MKKIIIFLAVFFICLICILGYLKYLWRGTYVQNGGPMVQSVLMPNGIEFNILPVSSIFGVSIIETKLDTNTHKIHVWYYQKFFKLLSGQESNSQLHVNTPGKYAIFYKNSDGSEQFIQEVEFK